MPYFQQLAIFTTLFLKPTLSFQEGSVTSRLQVQVCIIFFSNIWFCGWLIVHNYWSQYRYLTPFSVSPSICCLFSGIYLFRWEFIWSWYYSRFLKVFSKTMVISIKGVRARMNKQTNKQHTKYILLNFTRSIICFLQLYLGNLHMGDQYHKPCIIVIQICVPGIWTRPLSYPGKKQTILPHSY